MNIVGMLMVIVGGLTLGAVAALAYVLVRLTGRWRVW